MASYQTRLNKIFGSTTRPKTESQIHSPTRAIYGSTRRRDSINDLKRQLHTAIKQQQEQDQPAPETPDTELSDPYSYTPGDPTPGHPWPEPSLKLVETQGDGALFEICNHKDYADLRFIFDWGTKAGEMPVLLFDLDGSDQFNDYVHLPKGLLEAAHAAVNGDKQATGKLARWVIRQLGFTMFEETLDRVLGELIVE